MRTANALRMGAATLVCGTLAACLSTAPVSENICYRNPYFPDENHRLVTDIATQTLADHGIVVTDSFVTNKTRRSPQRRLGILRPHENEYIVGYDVWSHVEACDQGQVVAQFSADCRLQQIYTRYGCEIAGLP